MRIAYERELQELNQELKEMARQVEYAIDRTFIALGVNDRAAAREIIRGDRKINDMERTIEARCLSLMLKQTPVAGDLRVVSAALKVVTDLERIGDHASDIAELMLQVRDDGRDQMPAHLPEMETAVKELLHEAIEAFIARDDARARSIARKDDQVDWLFAQTKQEAARLFKERTDDAGIDNIIDFLMAAKYLERIGDHAVNICEWTQFSRTGSVNQIRLL